MPFNCLQLALYHINHYKLSNNNLIIPSEINTEESRGIDAVTR